TYTISVTDNNGCLSPTTITIGQPTPLTVSGTATPPICAGTATGTTSALVAGGTSPYTYTWSTFPAQSGTTATALTTGNYTVTVVDNHGCTTLDTVVVPQTLQV